jgi:hypothetical protein
MNRDWPEDKDTYERLDTDLSDRDPADVEHDSSEENDIERRDRSSAIIGSIDPQAKTPVSPDAVYADTDMNPNADDQKDAHHGEGDTV